MNIDGLMTLMPFMLRQGKHNQALSQESQSFLAYLLDSNEDLLNKHRSPEEALPLIHPDLLTNEKHSLDDTNLRIVEEGISPNVYDDSKGLSDEQGMTELTLNEQTIHNQELIDLVNQTTTVFHKLDKQNVTQAAPQILRLLKTLTLSSNKDNQGEALLSVLEEQMNEEEFKRFEPLLNSFNRRTTFSAGNAYKHESEVTVDDIAKWVNNAFKNQDILLENIGKQPAINISNSSSHMSTVEQYVIHLNESDRIERIQDQLVRQISTVLKQGYFLKGQEVSQLSFTLNPNNLGQLNIQLAQIDGELVVKIIATSVATKKMLETNVQQLKTMFAPHNITIERQSEGLEEVEQTEGDQEDHDESMNEEEDNNDQENREDAMTIQDDSFKALLSKLNE